jgi:hypothetical protein
MSREEIILLVLSMLASGVLFVLPLVKQIWKIFGVLAELRMGLADLNYQDKDLATKIDENRVRTVQLGSQIREIQNFLSKTTEFEVRS